MFVIRTLKQLQSLKSTSNGMTFPPQKPLGSCSITLLLNSLIFTLRKRWGSLGRVLWLGTLPSIHNMQAFYLYSLSLFFFLPFLIILLFNCWFSRLIITRGSNFVFHILLLKNIGSNFCFPFTIWFFFFFCCFVAVPLCAIYIIQAQNHLFKITIWLISLKVSFFFFFNSKWNLCSC